MIIVTKCFLRLTTAIVNEYMTLFLQILNCIFILYTNTHLCVWQQVHFLYQYSLQFFLEIFHAAISTRQLTSVKDYADRLNAITSSIFTVMFILLLLSLSFFYRFCYVYVVVEDIKM